MGWGIAVVVVALLVGLDVGSRRWRTRRHRALRAGGRNVWRATVPLEVFLRFQERGSWLSWVRDVVPADVELDDNGVHIRPVPRYASRGFSALDIGWQQVHDIGSEDLGHVRPDGSLTTKRAYAVQITTHQSLPIRVVLDEPPNELLSRAGGYRAANRAQHRTR